MRFPLILAALMLGLLTGCATVIDSTIPDPISDNRGSRTAGQFLDDQTTEIGSPSISGATVEAKLLDNVKDRTVLIFHKRRRKHSRKKNGHRQRHSKIQITKILSKDGKIIDEAKVSVAKKAATKEVALKKKATEENVTRKKVEKK